MSVTAVAQTIRKSFMANPGNGLLAGGIDRCDDHCVRIVKATAEFIEQIGKSSETMGLNDSDHPVAANFARSFQNRGNLNRMMAVVVEYFDPVVGSGSCEPPLHPGKGFKALPDILICNAKLMGNRDCRRGIDRIVISRHGKP
jgi:hypothetical protein